MSGAISFSATSRSESNQLIPLLKTESAKEIKVEHKDQLKLLIAELKKDPNSLEFHQPVAWQAIGLTNYP